MNKKRCAKSLYMSMEQIDPELLYDARAYRAPKIRPYLRYAVAAVIMLAVISTALILAATTTVKTYMTVDTNYGVTLETSDDSSVVRATSAASLYDSAANACRRMDAAEAVDRLLETMGERGGLSDTANTVLFGYTADSKALVSDLVDSLDTEKYCVITAPIEDERSVQKLAEKRRITLGKAAYIQLLSGEKSCLNEKRLFRLSVNDIALLAQHEKIAPGEITTVGSPSDSAYLSDEEVVRMLLAELPINAERIECSLDTDGFRLIYTVLLFEGDRGFAYIVTADSGEVIRTLRGAANTLHEQLDKVYEEFGTISANTPVYDDAPATVTATTAPADSKNTALTDSTVKPEASTPTAPTRAEKATVSPTETPKTQSSTDLTASQKTYLTASGLDDVPSLSDIQIAESEIAEGWFDVDQQPYQAYLIRNSRELQNYIDDYPSEATEMKNYFYEDFDDIALALVNAEDKYSSMYLNVVYFFRKGDVLYAGVFERTGQFAAKLLETPRHVQQQLVVKQKDIVGIKEIRTVRLNYDDVFGSSLVDLYTSVNNSGSFLRSSTWCVDPPGDAFTVKYKVDIGLDEFQRTLQENYPRDIDPQNIRAEDQEYYDHTASLLRTSHDIVSYQRNQTDQNNMRGLPFPPDNYMKDHAILMTTYVERYNSPSYFVTLWKKNGVLYVGFTDESGGGEIRNSISPTHVRVDMIELTDDQVRDIDRVEIVHLKGVFGSKGFEYAVAEPW